VPVRNDPTIRRPTVNRAEEPNDAASPAADTITTPAPSDAAPTADAASASNLAASDAERAQGTREVLQTWFAPYDDPIKQELAMIDEVIAAKAADPKTYKDGQNPYSIKYAVYNLRHPEVVKRLGEAHQQGVDVQILIEDKQLDPARTWNQADETLTQQYGFAFSPTHRGLNDAQRAELDLIGIKGSGLMHLKTRIFTKPDPATGKPDTQVLTGSLNPGDNAVNNNEALHLVTDPNLVARYVQKYEDVRAGKKTSNTWDPAASVNVLFTPAPSGPQPADKILEWVDQEKEAIFLSVFSLRNITSPRQREDLLTKLKKAKARGVKITCVTDRKQSDGVDAQGNRVAWDDDFEDKLRAAGLPVYECVNEAGPFNAMHLKAALFGLTDMKVVSDCGNWSQAALGSDRRSARNDESYLFVDSKKLDDNATGMRFLSNFLGLLRTYEHQQDAGTPGAQALLDELMQHPSWPKVKVDFDVVAKTYYGQDVYITGDHPALGDWTRQGPGLKLNTDGGKYPLWEADNALELPFGMSLQYKVVKRDQRTGKLEWEPGDNQLLVVDPGDLRNPARAAQGNRLQVDDEF
jgi:phosphatidylserine/phosphatidylglycerophosphate/cardiolipin synthase-like enzyme